MWRVSIEKRGLGFVYEGTGKPVVGGLVFEMP